ncbi:MAG: hypothetical protein M3O74_19100 [Pseudomonadota bacterium]|jgi:hypothetical protein|uniref:hypothetical protein n=1 Tax=Burkholderia sp. PAMC 28687 TaxID=1795874 RepID=UPI000A4FBF77|nr:hypothetical protein [Burkholderia sp. PAMC 28687]MDP9156340.1 hypothetical protein [Pseudomonadota bacterium]
MNASLNVSPMCRRCGDPVDLDAEICPSCGAIASPTAVRASAYSTMSGRTKGLIATAFVCVLGLAAYTLMPGSMHTAPVDTTASDVARTSEVEGNRVREPALDSRHDASMSAALDAVRESLQRHDMESAKVLLAAILAMHRDNPDALELRNEVMAGQNQDKPAAPVARTSMPPPRLADTRHTSAVVAATSRQPRSRAATHEHATRTSKKAPVVANKKVATHKVVMAKATTPKPSAVHKPPVLVREAQVKEIRSETPASTQGGTSRSVQTASGAPLVSSGTRQAPSSGHQDEGGALQSQRWRDRGGMR